MHSKINKFLYAIPFIILIFVSCKTYYKSNALKSPHGSTDEERLIDSILQIGLDNEALYTLLSPLKPMSSILTLRYPVALADSNRQWQPNAVALPDKQAALDTIARYQRAINHIRIPGVKLIMIPYKHTHDGQRLLQINAVRIAAIDSLLRAQARFFGQFGFVPGTDAAIVANTVEYEDQPLRLRGYGYLFGYPDYAVDFFVKANRHEEQTGVFIKRDFFQIPVYSGPTGHFVYAMPKGHKPAAATDSVIYTRAKTVLEQYRRRRSTYLNPDSSVQAYRLIKEFYGNQK